MGKLGEQTLNFFWEHLLKKALQTHTLRVGLLAVFYSFLLFLSLQLAYFLRFIDFDMPKQYQELIYVNALWVVPFKLILLYAFGQFKVMLTYFRVYDLARIMGSMLLASLFLIFLWYLYEGEQMPPRGVILSDFVLSVALLSGARLMMRVGRERMNQPKSWKSKTDLALIVGTGEAAESLASDLLSKPGLGIRPVGFLDTDPRKKNIAIHGLRVVGAPDELASISREYPVDRLIIALPPEQRAIARKVYKQAKEHQIPAEIVPSLHELASGQVKATQLRPVQFEDLLGRSETKLDTENIRKLVHGQIVLVTGAAGSIGSEIVRQLVRYQPKQLILFDQSENRLFNLEQDMVQWQPNQSVVPYVGDITHETVVEEVFREYRPSLVFHAAAYKHVPIMERQPDQALMNNTMGSMLLARLANEYGVERFIFISTDKAINPSSIMGASKRLVEKYLRALAIKNTGGCEWIAVRFGNVLGSSGSVIPTFKKQIADGGPVTVTHPEVTRYFMTIPEASGLVLEAATIGNSGDIMVLDMGQPLKILDIAREMIRLSGLEPDVDIAIDFTGLRPGEKLHEELSHHMEAFLPTSHHAIRRYESNKNHTDPEIMYRELESVLNEKATKEDLLHYVSKWVPEYKASLNTDQNTVD